MPIYPEKNSRREYTGRWVVEVTRAGTRTRRRVSSMEDAKAIEEALQRGDSGHLALGEQSYLTVIDAALRASERLWKGNKSEGQSVAQLARCVALLGSDTLLASVEFTAIEDLKSTLLEGASGDTGSKLADYLKFIKAAGIPSSKHARMAAGFQKALREGVEGPTVNRHLAAFRTFFYWAKKARLVSEVPAFDMLPEHKGRTYILEHSDEPVLFEALRSRNPRAADFCQVLLDTGMRFAELYSLAPAQITAEWVHLVDTKANTERYVPLTERAHSILAGSLPWGFNRKQVVYDAWHTAVEASGIRRELLPHSLRHTFATRKNAEKVPLPTIQQLLGHRSVTTTMRYIHVQSSELLGAVRGAA
jgi:site-specific recombinase XerD